MTYNGGIEQHVEWGEGHDFGQPGHGQDNFHANLVETGKKNNNKIQKQNKTCFGCIKKQNMNVELN